MLSKDNSQQLHLGSIEGRDFLLGDHSKNFAENAIPKHDPNMDSFELPSSEDAYTDKQRTHKKYYEKNLIGKPCHLKEYYNGIWHHHNETYTIKKYFARRDEFLVIRDEKGGEDRRFVKRENLDLDMSSRLFSRP